MRMICGKISINKVWKWKATARKKSRRGSVIVLKPKLQGNSFGVWRSLNIQHIRLIFAPKKPYNVLNTEGLRRSCNGE